jgi:hypothetical protein
MVGSTEVAKLVRDCVGWRDYEGRLCQSGNVESSGGGSEFHRLQEGTMFYVSLDIRDERIAICVLGQTRQIVRRAQVRTIDEMMRMLEALPDGFGTQVASRGSDVAQWEAAVLNGSDRILSHGAPKLRMTPNGCPASPAIVSLRS